MEKISSLQNGRIKNLKLLSEKSSERKACGLFVVEGLKECMMALQGAYEIVELYFNERYTMNELYHLYSNSNVPLFELTDAVFSKAAYRESTSEVIALMKMKTHSLSQLKLSDNPLLIALESVEKPGNLGAVIRTIDAANADAVIVCDPRTDIYNPNVIRNSVGTVFIKQLAICSNEELFQWLQLKKIKSYAAALTATHFYYQTNLKEPTLLIFGTESNGLSPFWLDKCNEQIKIPMLGENDSLNVSNSVAIMVYEAKRQRDFT